MQRPSHRTVALAACLATALVLLQSPALAQYERTNLVSDQKENALHRDKVLKNAWGLAFASTSPIWTSDNDTGLSTLYDGHGNKQGLTVTVPPASGNGKGSPTGIVFNGSPDFAVTAGGFTGPSVFLFATLDGTISGWNGNGTEAVIAATNPGAVYTGLAITTDRPGGSNLLFAADNANNKVDVYDGKFQLTSFTDSTIPAGFAAYGIQDINNHVYVTYASTGNAPGGFIDIFDEDGSFDRRFASGVPLDQPWGLALAPSNFGPASKALLVSNNTPNGTINAFNAKTGKFLLTLKDDDGNPIVIDQVWGLEFGQGNSANGPKNHLFFTAGPNNYAHGLLGVIRFAHEED